MRKNVRSEVWLWLLWQTWNKARASTSCHHGCKLMPYGILRIKRPFAVGYARCTPLLYKGICDMWILKMLFVRKVIKLLQNPFHSMCTNTSRGLYIKQVLHVWCEHTRVIELLSHRKHLLSACKTHLAQVVLAKHTSAMT